MAEPARPSDASARAERLAASGALLSGFPPDLLSRGVQRALPAVSGPAEDVLARLAGGTCTPAALQSALRALPDPDIEALVAAVLELAAETVGEDEDEDEGGFVDELGGEPDRAPDPEAAEEPLFVEEVALREEVEQPVAAPPPPPPPAPIASAPPPPPPPLAAPLPAPDPARQERLAASGTLLLGFPGELLARGLARAQGQLSRAGAQRLRALARGELSPQAVVEALPGLTDEDIDLLVAAVVDVASGAAADEEDEDEAPGTPASTPASAPPPDPQRAERLSASGTFLRGIPPLLLARGLERGLEHLSDASADRLRPLARGGECAAEELVANLPALPDHDIDALVAAVLEVASGATDDEEPASWSMGAASSRPKPPPEPTPGLTPFLLEAGRRFELPARGEQPARTVTVERWLTEGGSGLIWQARDTSGAPLIVKTPRLWAEVPISLRVERAILEPLDHPNLITLLGSHEDAAGNLCLFLEHLYPNPVLHLNQPHLLERINVKQLRAPRARYLAPPPSTALELIHDLLRGIEALHAAGLVHNDVKLSNFLLAMDHPQPDQADKAYFLALARSDFHGVLIDAGGIRHQDALEELNRGQADPALPPVELTPVYAPPEALLGRLGDPSERPWHSPAADVYAAALVAYTTLTGYLPYSHLRHEVDPRDLDAVLDLKRAERRGQLSPIARQQLEEARFQDCRFRDPQREGHERCRAHFQRDMTELLLRRVSPDPAQRGSANEMRAELERAFSIKPLTRSQFAAGKPIGGRGPRLYVQRHFDPLPQDQPSRLDQAAGTSSTRRIRPK